MSFLETLECDINIKVLLLCPSPDFLETWFVRPEYLERMRFLTCSH